MVKTTLAPNILPKSILVIDLPKYLDTETVILFCDNMVKVHLFDFITLNKPKYKSHVTDQIVAENILR
jgi:hypothetical protein